MTLQEQIAAAIVADGRSIAKVARDADMSYPTLLYMIKGADSRLSKLEAIADELGLVIILSKRICDC